MNEAKQDIDRTPHVVSPEISGDYRCQHCGNTTEFQGQDSHVHCYQDFTVEGGEPDYSSYDGGDIMAYDAIHCSKCEKEIWSAPDEAARFERLKEAAKQVIVARDTLADGGTVTFGKDQAFDDWAADLLDAACAWDRP